MNKTAIRNFAIWARNKLIADIEYKAGLMGITEKGIAAPLPQSTNEVQFFDKDLIDVCEYLADKGMRVMCAGLDKDFRGEPFGVVPELLTRAEFVTKLTAVCAKCGAPATRTQRIVNGVPASFDHEIVMVGAKEHYEPRCRHCHEILNKPKKI